MKLLGLLMLAGLLAVCGGGRTPLDPGPTGPTGGGHGGSGADLGNPRQTGGSPGVDDAGHGACYGNCQTPPGPVQVNMTFDELAAVVVGVWQICSDGHGLFAGAPSDTIGVEFGPSSPKRAWGWEGNLYFLKRGPSGPVRGDGPDYQQTYQVVDDMTVSCWSPGDKFWSSFESMYSPCPRELWLEKENGHNGTLASF
jgi:hypothetical protein